MKIIKTAIILISLSNLSYAQTVIGSGTINKIPKFTAASTIGNSNITDNGTTVSLGTASVAIGTSAVTAGDFVTISKHQNGITRLAVRNLVNGSINGSELNVVSPHSNITLSAFPSLFTNSGIFEYNTGVLNAVGAGGLNLGTTSNAQVSLWTNNIKRMSITNNGDVGIGTSTPSAKLDINGVLSTGLRSAVNHSGDYGYNTVLAVTRNLTKAFAVNNDADLIRAEKLVVWGSGRLDIEAVTKTDKYFSIYDFSTPSTPVEAFSIQGNGATKIVTDEINAFEIKSVTTNSINFRVKNTGVVYAREVNVQLTAFPDYVFSSNYQLTPLNEVEKYIISNKHLKGFESAITYESKGMNIGEVVRLQQEKIEELTLYLIEQQKQLNELKKQIELNK